MATSATIAPTAGIQWVADFFRVVDTVDIDKLSAWFADDIELRFANNPPITDKGTALHVMTEFYGSIAGMKHESEIIVRQDDDTVSQQAIVTYTRHDGREVRLPVSSYMHRNQAAILDKLWIYIDIAPLYAEAATS